MRQTRLDVNQSLPRRRYNPQRAPKPQNRAPQHTDNVNNRREEKKRQPDNARAFAATATRAPLSDKVRPCAVAISAARHSMTSQRSLHNAPIFRLLLKVAVNGTHQCDFLNFCGGLGPQPASERIHLWNYHLRPSAHRLHCRIGGAEWFHCSQLVDCTCTGSLL